MAEIFRVYKQGNFTVMSNHHLQNSNLSLKAMGLLSKLLSLPDDWHISIRGMAKICKDGYDSIRTAFKELITEGYVIRKQMRDPLGKLSGIEYIVRESPDVEIPDEFINDKNPSACDTDCEYDSLKDSLEDLNKTEEGVCAEEEKKIEKTIENRGFEPYGENPCTGNPSTENPSTGNPTTGNPTTGNPTRINTNITNNTNKLNTNTPPPPPKEKSEVEVEERIKQKLGYSALLADNDKTNLDAIVRLLVRYESGLGQYAYIDGKKISAAELQKKFLSLRSEDIERVLCSVASAEIKNMTNYLISSLYRTRLRSSTEKPEPPQINSKNRFNNFHQRDYDFDDLERRLLNT